MKIRQVEWAAFLKEFIEKGRFEAILLGWNTGLDPDQFDIWSSTKTKPGELNVIGYKNPEVDALLAEGRHTFDREKRRQAYFHFQEILAEDQPYTFLFVPDALPAISRRFRGIKPAARRHRLQLHQVVRPQGRAEVHHVARIESWPTIQVQGSGMTVSPEPNLAGKAGDEQPGPAGLGGSAVLAGASTPLIRLASEGPDQAIGSLFLTGARPNFPLTF